MSNIEQFYRNCKIFREQLAQIENHIKAHQIYTAFDFAGLHSVMTGYEARAQANTRVIDDALKAIPY
jgi:hypothetical protein